MTYNHRDIEKKWQKYWKDNKTFDFDTNDKRPKFYALSMFPYPSGELHAGHLKNFVIGDINARYKRMKGFNVLHPIGADAFGLPAENAAIKRGLHPSEWTKKNLDSFIKDMLACGLSYDMSRVFATCDPEYYGWQQQIFIDMYKKGLVVQKESYVNWDPVDQTVLANEQVVNGRGWRSDAIVERKLLKQWFIKITDYAEELLGNIKNGTLDGWPEKVRVMQENWIGKSEGAMLEFKIIDTDNINITFDEVEPDYNGDYLEVKNDKLGEYTDIKDLREKALEYYKNNFQGTFAERKDIGKIKFTGKGKHEIRINPAIDKLIILPYLKEIIETATFESKNELKHDRNDNIYSFFTLIKYIKLNNIIEKVRIFIGKDNEGNIFYDYFLDNNWLGYRRTKHRSEPTYNSTITQKNQKVNIIVKGDELGEYKDIKELRDKAIEYYKNNFQGTLAIRNDTTEIRFNKRARDEVESHSQNENKLKVMPFLKDIIENGILGDWQKLKHKRKDNIVEFAPITQNILLCNKDVKIRVFIGKDNTGNLFYDYFLDEEIGRISGSLEKESSANPTFDINITQKNQKVNTIKVYTTRPDTLFGASFLGISPDHPIAKELAEDNKEIADFIEEVKKGGVAEEELETMEKKGIATGIYVENPFKPEQELPVYIANFILMDYGTGAIFGCPAHDERDFQFAKKYNLPINPVLCQKEIYDNLEKMFILEPVEVINTELKDNKKEIIQDTLNYFNTLNNIVEHKILGKIKLTKRGIKDSIAHKSNIKKYNKLKLISLKSVPEIIKNSILINKEENWKKRDYNTYLLASPILIKNQNFIAEIVVIEYKDGNKTFYLHNITTKEYIKKMSKLSITGVQNDISNPIITKENLKVNSLLIKNLIPDLPFTDYGVSLFSEELTGLETKEAKATAINKIEEMGIGERKINYRLRDWGLSRQRYWGCPIPMVHCEKCGCVPEKVENLPIKLPEDVIFDGKGNPLDNHPTWKQCKCPKCGGDALRETDTMDTFVDSSWYMMRFTDLDKTKPVNYALASKLLPVDQYVGGIEHACMHLMYSRFFTMAMADLGYYDKNIREPAIHLLNQGMVQHKAYRTPDTHSWIYPNDIEEKDGKYFDKKSNKELEYMGIIKMSKSKSNVIGISDFLDEFGADSARLFVMSDNPVVGDFEWTADGLKNTYKYLTKIWNLVVNYKSESGEISKTLLTDTHKAVKDTTAFMENLEYNKAIARIREFSNLIGQAEGNKEFAIKNLVLMLAPFTPHLCEELNEFLKNKKTLDIADYPVFNETLTIDNELIIAIQINGKIRGEVKVKKDEDKTKIEELAKSVANVQKYLEGATIKKVIVVPNKLISFVI